MKYIIILISHAAQLISQNIAVMYCRDLVSINQSIKSTNQSTQSVNQPISIPIYNAQVYIVYTLYKSFDGIMFTKHFKKFFFFFNPTISMKQSPNFSP